MNTAGATPAVTGTQLTEQDLYDIVNGACLFGAGGGGPLSLGRSLVKDILDHGQAVTLLDPRAMPASEMTAVSAGVGSPDAASQGGFPYEVAGQALHALEQISGSAFGYVLPGEVGAANSIVPMTAAAARAIPILDAAGSPRAMPQFGQATFAIRGAPIGTIVLANSTVQVSFPGGAPAAADVIVRKAISSSLFTEDAGIACWAMDGATMQRVSLSGTTTRARELGACLRRALESDPVTAVCEFLGGEVLITGTIVDSQEATGGGFDVGLVTVADGSGRELQVVNQNENLLAWFGDSTHPAAMAPDLITFMTVDGQPFSLADQDLAKGKEIVVIAAPADAAYHDQAVIDAWLPLLRGAGYQGPYVAFG